MALAAAGHGAKGNGPALKVLAEAEAAHRRDHRPRPAHAWPSDSLLPDLPLGEAVQPWVRADFIDSRRMFMSLGRERFTGYVRLLSDDTHAAALVHEGSLVGAMFEWAGSVTWGAEAFSSIRDTIDSGHGLVETTRLAGEVFTATNLMITGPMVYEGLRGRFLRPAEFIDHLGGSGLLGALRAQSGERRGFVLLHNGVLGAYTSARPQLGANLRPVLELLDDPDCEVSVMGAETAPDLPLVIL